MFDHNQLLCFVHTYCCFKLLKNIYKLKNAFKTYEGLYQTGELDKLKDFTKRPEMILDVLLKAIQISIKNDCECDLT